MSDSFSAYEDKYPTGNPMGNSGSGLAAATRERSPVEREIDQLNSATSELNVCAEELQNRLSSVLRLQSEGVNEGVNHKKDSEPLTALPNAIREQKDNVNRATYILKSILSRLEL